MEFIKVVIIKGNKKIEGNYLTTITLKIKLSINNSIVLENYPSTTTINILKLRIR